MKSKQYFQSILIIHLAVWTGLSLFMAVTYFLTPETGMAPELESILQIIVGIASTGAVGINLLVIPKLKEKAQSANSLIEKLNQYRAYSIIRIASLEVVGLLAVIGYMMTAQFYFLVVAVVIWLLMQLFVGRKDKIIQEMQFSQNEIMTLMDDEALIS
jgi:hypothetical protein